MLRYWFYPSDQGNLLNQMPSRLRTSIEAMHYRIILRFVQYFMSSLKEHGHLKWREVVPASLLKMRRLCQTYLHVFQCDVGVFLGGDYSCRFFPTEKTINFLDLEPTNDLVCNLFIYFLRYCFAM